MLANTAHAVRAAVLWHRGSRVQTPSLTPVTCGGLSAGDRLLLPLGAPIPLSGTVPFPSPQRQAQLYPALFLIFCVSLLHADRPQAQILFPLAHLHGNPIQARFTPYNVAICPPNEYG